MRACDRCACAAIAGAWLILPFAGLEVAALGIAFVVYARRFGDDEKNETADLNRGKAQ